MPSTNAGEVTGDQRIRYLIDKVLRERKPKTVEQLVDLVVAEGAPVLPASDEVAREARVARWRGMVVRVVQIMREEGKVELSAPTRAFSSFGAYLADASVSAPFWLVLVAVALTWASIFVIPSEFPWVIPRWILGTVFVIFLPGYGFIEALFVDPLSGKRELDGIERFALSIGMSLALVPLTGLLLNYTPWGIRLEPIIIALSAITLICIFIATYRKFARLSSAKERAE